MKNEEGKSSFSIGSIKLEMTLRGVIQTSNSQVSCDLSGQDSSVSPVLRVAEYPQCPSYIILKLTNLSKVCIKGEKSDFQGFHCCESKFGEYLFIAQQKEETYINHCSLFFLFEVNFYNFVFFKC